MRRGSFGDFVVWVILLVVFGPMLAVAAGASIDVMLAALTPYVATGGLILLVFLGIRMILR